MSYNGSGTFVINTTGQPVVTGTSISSSVFNALTADLATGLSTAITKDGQTATTARIPFAQGISSTLVTDSTSTTTGSIITAGGVGVAKALFVGTTANVAATTDSSSSTTGAITTAGGVGIAKALNVGTTLAVAGNSTFAGSVNAPNTFGFKNRIINGAMVLDQRSAGALQTGIGNNTFIADRFSYQRAGLGVTAVFNCQQSTTAPTGYGNSAYLTATTGQTLGASGGAYMMYRHVIEGFNIADALRSQSSVTISFWTYFSNSGTYSLVATNAVDRSYATTYTVTAANTWQQITLTIPLTASGGTWNYTNGIGLELRFTLDAHDDVCTASNNAWVSTNSYGANGQTHGKVTTGATFYITGVQLEKGSTATSFDYRPYGTELQLCQRYFQTITQGSGQVMGFFIDFSTTALICSYSLGVQMRTTPTYTATVTSYRQNGSLLDANSTNTPVLTKASLNNGRLDLDGFTGLTLGDSGVLVTNSAGFTALTAEL